MHAIIIRIMILKFEKQRLTIRMRMDIAFFL